MAGKAFTEQIKFYTQTLASDSQGGKTASGETLSLTTLAEVKEKPLKASNADGQLTFYKGLVAEIWKNPSFAPTETTQVEWKGKRYAIQAINDSDTHNKQLLTLIARV